MLLTAPAASAAIELPRGPQLSELPGAEAVPNVSSVPGLPAVPGVTTSGLTPAGTGADLGEFSSPFAEPGPDCPHGSGPPDATEAKIVCKPAAVNIVALPNGKLLYWDGLEAEEDVDLNVVAEIGDKAVNDQSRLLDLSGPSWSEPSPVDGGANGSENTEYLLPDAPAPLEEVLNDPGGAPGALFCSDQVLLPDGRVLTPGGTHYYSEPHVPESDLGVAELEGLRNTRIYNPETNTWTQTGEMNYGRWYPSLVTLANGNVFVASGVTKLVKPVYPERPLDSGTNVRETETYDVATGKWTANGESASRSLPLYPRLHLLPDGKVYYDAAGQVFNPFGEAYDEATWIARRRLRPGDANMEEPRGAARHLRRTRQLEHLADARLPRLVLLDHAPAQTSVHEGAVPLGRRGSGDDARELRADERERDQHRRHGPRRRLLLDRHRPADAAAVVLDRGPAPDRQGDDLLGGQPR